MADTKTPAAENVRETSCKVGNKDKQDNAETTTAQKTWIIRIESVLRALSISRLFRRASSINREYHISHRCAAN